MLKVRQQRYIYKAVERFVVIWIFIKNEVHKSYFVQIKLQEIDTRSKLPQLYFPLSDSVMAHGEVEAPALDPRTSSQLA